MLYWALDLIYNKVYFIGLGLAYIENRYGDLKLKVCKKSKWTKAGWLLLYLYIVLLSYFLFFSEHYGRNHSMSSYRYNLVLLKEIRRFIEYREQIGFVDFFVNIIGNVLAFAPFGFLLPLMDKKYRKAIIVILLSMLFSLCVEVVQLLLKVGIFDVDDILLNTIGGMLGYLFYAFCSFLSRFMRPGRKRR